MSVIIIVFIVSTSLAATNAMTFVYDGACIGVLCPGVGSSVTLSQATVFFCTGGTTNAGTCNGQQNYSQPAGAVTIKVGTPQTFYLTSVGAASLIGIANHSPSVTSITGAYPGLFMVNSPAECFIDNVSGFNTTIQQLDCSSGTQCSKVTNDVTYTFSLDCTPF